MSQQQQAQVDYNSRVANNRTSVLGRNKTLVYQGLVLNLLYFMGATSFVIFAVLELKDREREPAALVTYTIGFVLFLLTGLGELYIDVVQEGKQRGVRHGRYSKTQLINLLISSLFVVGTLLDVVAFFLWMARSFVTEHRVLYASAHVWLVTAIVALCGSVPIVQTQDVMEGLDDAGNLLFLLGCVIDCIVRYVDTDFESGSPPIAIARLEFSSAPMWLASALCYTVADAMRVRRMRQGDICLPMSGV